MSSSVVPSVAAGAIVASGYRLQRLEVFNWGTFDSSGGQVHVIPLLGETTLLVGHNGSGKSTLVDALLTLLVQPGNSRNFNVAAGASKGERNERSYIRGAYDRRSDEESRSEVKYLRDGRGQYSALLACFRDAATGNVFSLAVILYLTADNSVEKLYCFAPEERSIAANCSGLRSMDKLGKQMQERGFAKTTKSYQDYAEWFRKTTGVQPQAMDMFNQTVAVKDIQRLNDFIRKHMLDAKPWGEKVDDLLLHFQDLSDAHRDLLRVTKQVDLLKPVAEHGAAYRDKADELRRVERLLRASEAYFPLKAVEVFAPALDAKKQELTEVAERKSSTKVQLEADREQCRELRNAIEQAGGERLRQLPTLIEKHESSAQQKRRESQRFHDALQRAGMSDQVTDDASLQFVRDRFSAAARTWQQELTDTEEKRRTLIYRHGNRQSELSKEELELQTIRQRKVNIPARQSDLRRNLCAELRLKEQELPFVAELIAVKATEREWESSIEMVLHGFALTLLVPDEHYALVSRYIERTELRDAQGQGQRLVYQHVGRSTTAPQSNGGERSLLQKLEFKAGQTLLPWVKAEVLNRFDYRCCETIEEFQSASGRALTRNRHVKHPGGRHEKNDRAEAADPRRYVLGWDNREKQWHLEVGIQALRREMALLTDQIDRFDTEQSKLRERLAAITEAALVTIFTNIDFAADEREAAALRLEKQALEENNDAVRMLKQRQAEHEQRIKNGEADWERLIRESQRLEGDIKQAEQILFNARKKIEELRKSGAYEQLEPTIPEIEPYFSQEPFTFENLASRQGVFIDARKAEHKNLTAALEPFAEQLRKSMTQYLRAFTDDKVDLVPDIKYLDDFLALFQRINEEELPKHERRFKERLNEKVGEEVSLLRSSLLIEREHIQERIDVLNLSLRQLEYRDHSHMQLRTKPVRDREIIEFRQSLDECVSGSFDGSPEANEDRYKRIEKVIYRLRDEDAWRRKVTDVRNWFDFAAVETDDRTGAELSYHEDSHGQSGGEKAKLAFTILVAAIHYQYDLQPEGSDRSRFHFVVVDEMFSRIDDRFSQYALELFAKFRLQLLIVAPLDAKARITEPYVGCYLHVAKNPQSNHSEVFSLTARQFQENFGAADGATNFGTGPSGRPRKAPK